MNKMTFLEMLEQFEAGKTTSVDVVDLSRLTDSVDKLYKLNQNKAVGDIEVAKLLKQVSKQLSAINVPQFPDSIRVTNQADWTQQFSKLTKAVKDFEAMYHMHEMEKMKHHNAKKEEVRYVQNEEENYAEESKEVDLKCYRVADSIEPVSGYQYFGFVKPDGCWYILYNDANEGKLRYKFGSENYTQAWEQYDSHDYKLLNEAVNEI